MQRPGFDGLLVLDKPARLTSRDAVNRALGWFPRGIRIGHTGTLDPLATGVLVLCASAARRGLTEYVQAMPKTYRAAIKLDAASDTDDADGIRTPIPVATPPTCADIEQALGSFLGTIEQVPPKFSAARVTGRRAYDLARQGREVSLTPRTVTIHAIDVLAYAYPDLDIHVRCGKGTYIRSLGARPGAQARLRRLHLGLAPARSRLLPRKRGVHPGVGCADCAAAVVAYRIGGRGFAADHPGRRGGDPAVAWPMDTHAEGDRRSGSRGLR